MSSFLQQQEQQEQKQEKQEQNEKELLIESDINGLEIASNYIINGELLAFPTETVYGLGANALNEKAVLSIFEAKGRPLTDPLIVHVPDINKALNLISTDIVTESIFQLLGNQFWPGPLTIIAKAAPCIPNIITANTGFVGIRIPAHPLALEFLRKCNLPIAAPSANKFGHVSPTKAQHVLDDLGGKGVHVLNGDGPKYEKYTCQHGIESTILKIDLLASKIYILRQGAISQPEIEQLLQSSPNTNNWNVESIHRAVNHSSSSSSSSSTTTTLQEQQVGEVAPGQLLTHYAPYVPCTVINSIQINSSIPLLTSFSLSDPNILSRYMKETITLTSDQLLSNTIIIDFNSQFSQYSSKCLAYCDLSSSGSTIEAAKELFNSLRWAENQLNATRVLLAPIILRQDQQVQIQLLQSQNESKDDSDSNSNEIHSINQKYDPSLGLADRIFRASSGVAVDIEIQ